MSRGQMIGFDALSGAELDAWNALRRANPALDSPYFDPGFAAAVHGSGRPVQVAVVRDAKGAVSALLPGHVDGNVMCPVGWPGSDFQGPICAPATTFDPAVLFELGVRRYEFDHLLEVPGFEPYIDSRYVSPFLDVSGGMPGYVSRASKSGRENMSQARRRAARAERELGPIRFEADVVDAKSLARVVELKRAQYASTGARDYFSEPDRWELVLRLLHTREPAFAGVLSTLHAGDALVAAHFGMRSGPVLHWWLPVYDPQFSALSPGWMLLRELVTAAPELGVDRIDLGRGDDEYKRRARTGEMTVCRGVVARGSTQRVLRRARQNLVDAAKSSPLAPSLRQIVRKFRAH
jgi:CelD/BcsL family acetyltransferase involved in cellulose biosynthesis